MTDMNIGRNMRRLREELGLDILDVSIDTNYSESHIAQIERGKRSASLSFVIDMIDYYGCDANTLFESEKDIDDQISDTSIEGRVKSLPLRDRIKVEKLIEAVLETFTAKGVE